MVELPPHGLAAGIERPDVDDSCPYHDDDGIVRRALVIVNRAQGHPDRPTS